MGNKRLGRRREFLGEAIRCDLKVRIAKAVPPLLEGPVLEGLVADDLASDPRIRIGTEVIVHINPASTAFRDPQVIGSGRIYEDRLEIDLLLLAEQVSALLGEWPDGGQLQFQTRTLTEGTFRIEAVARG